MAQWRWRSCEQDLCLTELSPDAPGQCLQPGTWTRDSPPMFTLRPRRGFVNASRPANAELEPSGACEPVAHAMPGGLAAEKEELCLCGGRLVARGSIPGRYAAPAPNDAQP